MRLETKAPVETPGLFSFLGCEPVRPRLRFSSIGYDRERLCGLSLFWWQLAF